MAELAEFPLRRGPASLRGCQEGHLGSPSRPAGPSLRSQWLFYWLPGSFHSVFRGSRGAGSEDSCGGAPQDNFLGIYHLKAGNHDIPQVQRATLERLAAARTNGVTQSELAKEFGMKGNNFFLCCEKPGISAVDYSTINHVKGKRISS